MKGILVSVCVLVCFDFASYGQEEIWDLQRCVTYAVSNNITVKQAEITSLIQYQSSLASKGKLLPSVNGYANHSYNVGQRIDPFTNQFANNSVRSNNFYLSTSVPIWSGFQLRNGVIKAEHELSASHLRIEKVKNDISLAVVSAYMAILFNEELEDISKSQISITKQQLARMNKMVQAGERSKGELLQIEAQLATEELAVINCQNNLALSHLSLKQLLELDPVAEIDIIRPEISIADDERVESTPGQVYQASLDVLPEVKEGQERTKSAEVGLLIAKGAAKPSISLSASSGTGYSGASKEVESVTQGSNEVIGFTNSGVDVLAPTYDYVLSTKSFGDQVADNLNHSVALNLNIPIFNGYSAKTATERARLNMEMALLNEELTKNQIEKDIQIAHANAAAALNNYMATKKSVEALTASFGFSEQRFSLGMITSVEYNDAKNKMIKSQSDLLQAKYDYTFKVKILNFYQGRSLTL